MKIIISYLRFCFYADARINLLTIAPPRSGEYHTFLADKDCLPLFD